MLLLELFIFLIVSSLQLSTVPFQVASIISSFSISIQVVLSIFFTNMLLMSSISPPFLGSTSFFSVKFLFPANPTLMIHSCHHQINTSPPLLNSILLQPHRVPQTQFRRNPHRLSPRRNNPRPPFILSPKSGRFKQREIKTHNSMTMYFGTLNPMSGHK